MKQLQILKFNKLLYNLSPYDLPGDDFPGGGGGGGGVGGGDGTTTTGGGTNGGQSGTTSSVIIPSLSISPSTSQSIAVGTTLCFSASGSIYLPQEPEQFAIMDVGNNKSLGTGTWTKTVGNNPAPDAETLNSTLLYRQQPFYIQGQNGVFGTPGGGFGSMVNTDALIGVKSTNGYLFYWDVMRYCNATPAGICTAGWSGYARMIYPSGVGVTIGGGPVEFNQKFKIKSDGTAIIWEYTTRGNWAYNYTRFTIPEDSGDFQFYVNALYVNNTWTNLKTYRGSYQGTVKAEDFIWNSNCIDQLTPSGATACYTAITPGSCQVCVSTINTEPKCVNVVSSPLFLKPTSVECKSCGDVTDCSNIPDPIMPNITVSSTASDNINVIWQDSVSFTSGLYYEVDINGTSQNVLDSSINLIGLSADTYAIKVRAVDDCGASAWSTTQSITIPSASGFSAPANFNVEVEDDSNPSNIVYKANWDSVPGAVAYEVWAGDPPSTLLKSTILTEEVLGVLPTGLQLRVRAIDPSNDYSPYSTIEVIP